MIRVEMKSPCDPQARSGKPGNEELVLHLQGPVYTLCRRMVRNAEDAADLTQETFVAILRGLHRYDPRRDLSPWVYRVAVNVVYRFLRDSRLRREKERLVPMRREPLEDGERIEREELEALMQDRLHRLPDRERALLLLHYYHGLSQREVGKVLSLPRSSVQFRLEKALEKLKGVLREGGHFALLPGVETVMRSAGPLEVPPALSESLLALSAPGAGPAAALGFTMGGIIVSKKIAAGFVLVMLLSLGLGTGLGTLMNPPSSSGGAGGEAAARATAADLRRQVEALEAERRKLEGLLASSRTEVGRLRGALARAREESEGPAGGRKGGATEVRKEDPSTIDWDRLFRLFAENRDILAGVAERRARGERPEKGISPEEVAALREVMAEWSKAAAT